MWSTPENNTPPPTEPLGDSEPNNMEVEVPSEGQFSEASGPPNEGFPDEAVEGAVEESDPTAVENEINNTIPDTKVRRRRNESENGYQNKSEGRKYHSRPGRHSRRMSDLSRQLIDDYILPPDVQEFQSATASAPSYLRGIVLKQYVLKQRLLEQVSWMIEGEGGIANKFGFQIGPTGGAHCAVEALTADLCGGGGHPMTPEETVAMLHENVFENYNNWAIMVGGKPVYSSRLANPAMRIAEDKLDGKAVAEALQHADRVLNGPLESIAIPDADQNSGATSPNLPSQSPPGTNIGGVTGRSGSTPVPGTTPGGTATDNTPAPASRALSNTSTGSQSARARNKRNRNVSFVDTPSYAPNTAVGGGAAADGVLPLSAGAQFETMYTKYGDGANPRIRLYELCLWYCIRTESANLRFCPELICWLFHQMRWEYRPPLQEEVLEHIADTESSFFSRTTVTPLYELMKRAAKKSEPTRLSITHILCCCRKMGRERTLRNSIRPNYDDLNEVGTPNSVYTSIYRLFLSYTKVPIWSEQIPSCTAFATHRTLFLFAAVLEARMPRILLP